MYKPAKRIGLRTTNIKGKDYVEVNTRVEWFREHETKYADWSLTTEIIEITKERCILKAVIADETGRVRATGLAYEDAGTSYINKTSYIENCETSAWGRALGNLGIGISSSIASKEEVENAIAQQDRIKQEQIKLKHPTIYDHSDDSHKRILWECAKKIGLSKEHAIKISESATEKKILLDNLGDFVRNFTPQEILEG